MGRPRRPRHVRIFLASPGDVLQERQAVRDLMQRLERAPLLRGRFTIEVVSWDDPEAPAPMLATLTPQQAVSRALPKPSDCDFTLVILWSRMGTPLEERKWDGSPYLSGTEWEFEDARRAGKPILLYRRTALPPPDGVSADADQQRHNVEQFFAQFTAPSGALRGSVTTFNSVEEFSGRLRTDIESLLLSLPREEHEISSDSNWYRRAEARVRRWHYARLLFVLVLGAFVTIIAWTAFASFLEALSENDPPLLAYVIRYIFVALGVLVPVLLVLMIWWWLGRETANRED
jgi:hypothetical protein